MHGYKVNIVSIGNGEYNAFIKDEGGASDYIRLSFGVLEAKATMKNAKVLHQWITEPKSESGTFLGRLNKSLMHGRRLWIIFETVQRQKGKRGIPLKHYMGLSPVFSKWRTSVGAETLFELKEITLDEYHQISARHKIETSNNKKLA